MHARIRIFPRNGTRGYLPWDPMTILVILLCDKRLKFSTERERESESQSGPLIEPRMMNVIYVNSLPYPLDFRKRLNIQI